LIDIGRFAALRRARLWYDPGRRHCADIEERRMKTAIVNIGQIVSGDWKSPFQSGDAILCEDGLIQSVGTLSAYQVSSADVVIDAGGATAIPGLIDSHVHITFGDYTPRQKTVGYLESYLHGGVTTAISASEVHVPGRPKDPIGVKALAVAAARCFKTYRPGGMRVHAGSVILEPGLNESDFAELRDQGVWLAKAGFGAFATPFDYAEQIAWAKQAGMITTMHTGGSSIPGSSGIWADHLLAVQPHVSFHVNGGPVAMPDKDFPRLVEESEIALQICTAGNLRTTLLVANLARKANAFHRVLIATDTPTGSGIMPLGMLYTISHLASLTDLAPELAIAAATGNNADVYKLNSGFLRNGRDADIVLIDACAGGSQDDALSALRNGDVTAVGAVVTAGIPRFVGRSRNTPATIRRIRVAECRLPMDFSGADH
jgi:enamidase